MGCLLVGLFTLPFYFMKWCFTNGVKGYIVGGLVIAALLIGFFVVRGEIHKAMAPEPPAVTSEVALPGVQSAPYQVDTWSRTYYAAKAVKDKDGTVTMSDYWELSNGQWVLNKGVLVLDENYGKVNLIRR